MISCIIVDDNNEMIELLVFHLMAKPELELKATFTNPLEAFEYLVSNEIDIVFLDIEMPKLTGFDFIERFKNQGGKNIPSFILTTGFPKYAVESYEYDVLDYIVKPITFKRFNSSISKYLKVKLITNVDEQLKNQENDFFFVENKEKTQKIKVNFEDIIYIESEGNYISLHTISERIMVYKSLQNIQDKLDSNLFIRVFRSYIVSIRKIDAIREGELVMKCVPPKIIPIGDFYKSKVMKRLKIL
jgi:two-component system, LytTR family, response regulator